MINIIVEDYKNKSQISKYINNIEENTKYFITFINQRLNSIVSIKYLEFDSKIFNKKIGSLNVNYGKLDRTYAKELMKKIEKFCVEERYECLFARSSPADYGYIHMLEDSGFNLMDSIITLKKKITPEIKSNQYKEYTIRLLNESNLQNVLNIIDNLYCYGRFFEDPNLNSEDVNKLYKQWITNEIKNSNVDVIGIEKGGNLLGFISCKYNKQISGTCKEGLISLLGIAKSFQGIGIGKILMNEVLNNFYSKQIDYVCVGTQIDNINALNYYIANGFRVTSSKYSFHKLIK